MNLNEIAKEIVKCRKEKGFHTSLDNIPEKLMLIVTECAEAMEEYRNIDFRALEYNEISPENPFDSKPIEQFGTEIGDVVIRCLDVLESLGFDSEKVILDKIAFNWTRPSRHGRFC